MTAADVMDSSAAMLNDTAKTIYTYTAQIPYLNIAIRDVAAKLQLNNVPVSNATSAVIPISALATTVTLPSGLIEIQQLWQRPTGTSNPFIPVQKYEFIPHYFEDQITSLIPAWAWIAEAVVLVPANTALDIKLDFIKNTFSTITLSTDVITLLNGQNLLAFRTAALCARFIGENATRADDLDGQALDALDTLLGISSKGGQAITTRRRPFMASLKSRGGW